MGKNVSIWFDITMLYNLGREWSFEKESIHEMASGLRRSSGLVVLCPSSELDPPADSLLSVIVNI